MRRNFCNEIRRYAQGTVYGGKGTSYEFFCWHDFGYTAGCRQTKSLKKLIEVCCPCCQVLGFTNGDEALDLIKDKAATVDLCFSDIEQEGAGGFELNRALVEKGQMAVVLVTKSSKQAMAARQEEIKGYVLHNYVTLERIAYEIYYFNSALMVGCDDKICELTKKLYLKNCL